jgi:hypothetical protein
MMRKTASADFTGGKIEKYSGAVPGARIFLERFVVMRI